MCHSIISPSGATRPKTSTTAVSTTACRIYRSPLPPSLPPSHCRKIDISLSFPSSTQHRRLSNDGRYGKQTRDRRAISITLALLQLACLRALRLLRMHTSPHRKSAPNIVSERTGTPAFRVQCGYYYAPPRDSSIVPACLPYLTTTVALKGYIRTYSRAVESPIYRIETTPLGVYELSAFVGLPRQQQQQQQNAISPS